MPQDSVQVNSYEQLEMIAPRATIVCLTVGIMPDDDHVQVQVERREAASGRLVSMWSLPHNKSAQLAHALAEAVEELLLQCEQASSPF